MGFMKGFVFDLDNTLYDRYATIAAFLKADWERALPYINPAYDYQKAISHLCHTEALFVQKGWKNVYEHLVAESFFHPNNVPDYQKVRRFALDGFGSVAVKFPYTEDVLKAIKAKGYQVALLSNDDDLEYQLGKMDKVGITQYFDPIVVAGELSMQMCGEMHNKEYFKPNKAIFLHTAKLPIPSAGAVYRGGPLLRHIFL